MRIHGRRHAIRAHAEEAAVLLPHDRDLGLAAAWLEEVVHAGSLSRVDAR
jgi:hypothetical protein